MFLTRNLKRWVCQLMLGAIFFAQLSLAAYACPGMASSAGQVSAMASMTTMVNCDQMAGQLDKEQPNLCAEHCHHTQQSDQAQVPTLPAMLLISLYTVAPAVSSFGPSWPARSAQDSRLDTAPPPLSILHCCFRL